MLLEAIDKALLLRMTDKIKIRDKQGALTIPVPIRPQTPERFLKEAVWPAITFWMYDSIPDFTRDSHQPKTGIKTLSEDGKSANVRNVPLALDEYYQIDSWAQYAEHDRLLQKALWTLFPYRTSLEVFDDDNAGASNVLWMLHEDYRPADILEGETRLYHKIWTWRIMTALDVDPGINTPTAWQGLKVSGQTPFSPIEVLD